MILVDFQIRHAIEHGDIGCEPTPEWEEQLQASSLDLRLANDFKRPKGPEVRGVPVRPVVSIGTDMAPLMEALQVADRDTFLLRPGQFALASTREYVRIPPNMTAIVEGRSSLGRRGLLIHITAGYIDPGFEGNITLELLNVSPWTIELTPGERVCQVHFHMGEPAANPYCGKYQGQRGVTESRLHLDQKKKQE